MSFAREQLLPGEKLIVLARQHIIILLKPLMLVFIILALLSAISIYLHNVWLLIFLLVPFGYFTWEILIWRRREYILTDRRVVRQEGVFSTASFDTPLDKINNVFHRQSFLGRLLQYGEVGLESASEQGTTVFDFLSKPLDLKNQIVRQRELYRSYPGTAGITAQPSIPRLLEELASLRSRNIISEQEFQEKKKSLLEKI